MLSPTSRLSATMRERRGDEGVGYIVFSAAIPVPSNHKQSSLDYKGSSIRAHAA